MIDKNYDANGSEVLDAGITKQVNTKKKSVEQIAEEHLIFLATKELVSIPDDNKPRNRVVVLETVDIDDIVESMFAKGIFGDHQHCHTTISRLRFDERSMLVDFARKNTGMLYTVTAIDKIEHRAFVEDLAEAVSAQYSTVVMVKIHTI
jgi:hypothetical protein